MLRPVLDGKPAESRPLLARETGLPSAAHVSSCLITAKRRYKRILAEIVGDTLQKDGDVDDELRYLRQVLRRVSPAPAAPDEGTP